MQLLESIRGESIFANYSRPDETVPTKALVVLFMIAVVIRLTALWFIPEPHLSTNATLAYLGGAHMLLEGDGFRDPSFPVFTPPLYAMAIAISSIVFGEDQVAVKVAQIVADSMTVVLLYFIVREVFGGKVGLLSSALWVVYPFAIFPTIYIGTETFFTFLLSFFILLSIYAIRSQSWKYFCSAGVLLGLATLMRGTTQFLPFVFPLLLFLYGKVDLRGIVNSFVLCVSFLVVIMPWTLRNYIVLGDFILVAAASNVFLWGSAQNFLTIDERNKTLPLYFEKLQDQGFEKPPRGSTPLQKDRFYLKAGIENYRSYLHDDPLSLVEFIARKFLRLWYSTESGDNHAIIIAINLPVYVLSIAGIVIAWLRKDRLAMCFLFVLLYFVAIHLAALPLFRYMVPIMPYAMAFAAVGIIEVNNQIGTRRRERIVEIVRHRRKDNSVVLP